jgi:hypothetical protein
MKIIEGDNCYYYDCDDTLVMWDNIYKTEANTVLFNCHGFKENLVPHQEHISHLKKAKTFDKATIIVWSAGGWEWAKEVVEKLGIEEYVDAVMTKPNFYIDDLACKEFMGTRIYKPMPKPINE